MAMENEDNHMTEEEDCTFCHIDQSKKLPPINIHLQDSSKHGSKQFTFGNWELVQWFQFCRPKNTEDTDLKDTNHNDYINRKMENSVTVQSLLHLENYLDAKGSERYLEVPVAPALSAQKEQSMTVPNCAWSVNTSFKEREKFNFIQLSTPNELKASIKTKNSRLQEFSTYLNNCSSSCDLLAHFHGTEREDLFENENVCERSFSFLDRKSEFENTKCSIVCEDLKKNVPTNYNLDITEELQVSAIRLPSSVSEHSFFQNEINLHSMFCKEDRNLFCRALFGLQFRIPHAQAVLETDHTYCERHPCHGDPAKDWQYNKQSFDKKQNVHITKNILNPPSAVSEMWEYRPFSVGKTDVLGQRTHMVKMSSSCSNSILTNAQICIQKKRKRKVQMEGNDEEVHNVKRYRKCFAPARAAMGECKESINISHAFGVFGEIITNSIIAKRNECWSSFKMTESTLKYTDYPIKLNRKYNGEMSCNKNKGFSIIEHFLFPTLEVFHVMKYLSVRFHIQDTPFYSKASSRDHFIMYATTLQIVFPNKLSVCCRGSFEPAHLCTLLYENNNISRLLLMLFQYVISEIFNTPYMSDKNIKDMSCKSNCIQFGLEIYGYMLLIKSNLPLLCDEHCFINFADKFLKKEEKNNDIILKTFIVSGIKEHFILLEQLISEQYLCKTSGKLKCHQTSSVAYLFKYSDRKKRFLKKSEMYCSYKLPLKESSRFIGNDMSMQNDFCTVCNDYSPLFHEIKYTNINVFETPIMHTEDIIHLCNLCFIEKCIYFEALCVKYISAPNSTTSSAKSTVEKASDFDSSVVLMARALEMHFKENTRKISKHTTNKENLSFSCIFGYSDTNEKNSSKNALEVEMVNFSRSTANTYNTITLKEDGRKNWGKSKTTSICSNTCLFSVLDTYQKIPLATTFDDQDIITFTSCERLEVSIESRYVNANFTINAPNPYMAHLTDLSVCSSHLSIAHNCAERINVSAISPKWLYPQMDNLNLPLMSFEQKCTTESIQETRDNEQFLDSTELYVKPCFHDPDSETVAMSFSDDANCSVSICEDDACSRHLTMSTLEHTENGQTDAIKESPIALPVPKALYTLELQHETLITKHTSPRTKDKQMRNSWCKDGVEPVELECTIDKRLFSNSNRFVNQRTYEKIIEAMLPNKIRHKSVSDLNMINAESLITFKELPCIEESHVKFEMKSQFDLVLEELAMFIEISKVQEVKPSHENIGGAHHQPEACDLANDQEVNKKDEKCFLESTLLPCTDCHKTKRHTMSKSPGLCEKKESPRKQEQEVPNVSLYSNTAEEESLYLPTNEDDTQLENNSRVLWSPAFLPLRTLQEGGKLSLDEYGGCFSHGIGRVQPLKTCIRPIRVGLSKKVKTKQLHPYLKQVY